ncbi:type II secretion system F family protein [Candidatus Woesearchaeota archaeon]|nr:type II secretion system F family protein [Candidatus Woesearchaeota archaeon]
MKKRAKKGNLKPASKKLAPKPKPEIKIEARSAKSEAGSRSPAKQGFFSRIFSRKKNEGYPSKVQAAPAKGSKGQKGTKDFDKHLSTTINRFKKKKEEKAHGRKEKIFTIRGFIRTVDLQGTLEKAGLSKDPKEIARGITKANIVIFSIITLFYILQGIIKHANIFRLILFIAAMWIAFFFLVMGVLWLIYLFYLDMKIYQRTKEVEKVFPDFLQLASSNISAGMPIDRALWYAVRPNFGVLAKEIETVAKNTVAGQDLSQALADFSTKYDSRVIKRSVSLILEGLAAGGELADLLNKIALDIEETTILKRDMAANVTTYVIFISFATIIAAPVLLGLSTELLDIISRITASLVTETPSTSTGMFTFSFSEDAVSVTNFKIFAYTMITISSISAACIVNVIQKGRVKDGLGKIPVFIVVSVILYLIASEFIGGFFGSLI